MKIKNTVVFILTLALAPIAIAKADRQPNIVFILADDLGWADTTLYGKASFYETPNIERLAARGMTFSSAYASPICSPTRASIMTGQNPARHGMTAPAAHLEAERFEAVASENGPPHQKCTNVRSATRLDPELPFLAKVLKDAGYSTAHFGKWHLGREPHSPLERGFDVDIPHWWGPGPKSSYLAPWGYANPNFKEGAPGEHIEDRMAKEAVTWLKNRDKSKPFFMNYWQFSVHAPFGAKPELIDRYRKKLGDSVDGLSKPEVRDKLLISHQPGTGLPQQSPTYAAMVHSLDDAVGSLLDALDEEGIADDTVIVFYSDNGGNIHCGLEETSAAGEKYITAITSNHPLRGGKGGIHEGGVRVPAVVVWPGVTKPGSRNDTRIQSTDLYPTILRMLNVERPKDHVIDGVDFAKALRGEKMDRGPMFTHVPGHGGTPHWLPPSMSMHYGDWKLIRTFHYGEDGKHEYRLYNLREDIGENHNLAAAHPEKVKELDKLIEDYITEAKVVVPLPNPNFDTKKFDPSKIGVQPGGLKMPPSSKSSRPKPGAGKPSKPVVQKALLGWSARNAQATVEGESLRIRPSGRQPFIANAKVRANGPVEVRLRVKTEKSCTGRLQWRNEGQDGFPESGQRKSFQIDGGDWRELTVPLAVEGRVIHVRLFMSDSKRPTEIDWIEIGTKDGKAKDRQRWDFKVSQEPSRPDQGAERQHSGTGTKVENTGSPAQSRNGAALGPAYETGSVRHKRPNVLLIAVDDLNDWVGCLGGHSQTHTPNIDRLAARGMLFTNAHCQGTMCNPSRISLLWGRRPSSTGFYDNHYPVKNEPEFLKTHVSLPAHFAASGYKTLTAGKVFHPGTNLNKHFQVEGPRSKQWLKGLDRKVHDKPKGWHSTWDFGPQDYDESKFTDHVTATWVAEQLGSEHDKPFFLAFGFYRPHVPFFPPRRVYDSFRNIQLPRVDDDDWNDIPNAARKVSMSNPKIPTHDWMRENGRWEQAVHAYLACVRWTDEQLGRVLDALDNGPHAENTIVVLFSDHGYHLGEKQRWSKFSLWERTTHVPLIISVPDGVKGRTGKPVELLSIYPTLIDLCGLPANPRLEGVSLRPLLEDPKADWKHVAISTLGQNNHAVRDERWRYIRYADGSEELYDHQTDPNEWTNIAAEPLPPGLHTKVIARLKKYLPKTNAPQRGNEPEE